MKITKIILIILSVSLLLTLVLFGLNSCSSGTQQGENPSDNNVPDTEEPEEAEKIGLFISGTDELVFSWEDLLKHELVSVDDTTLAKLNDKLTGDIYIPDDITKIKASAFSGCSGLSAVFIGPNVVEIGNSAFLDCTGLKSVTIEGSVTKIGTKAFYGCTGLASVVIGDGVTSIGNSAFSNCTKLKYLIVSDSVTSIGSSAFSGCTGLKFAYIGTNVTSIGASAFKNCAALERIFIPAKVSLIGGSAFYNCNVLNIVNYQGTAAQFDKITIEKSNTCLTEKKIKFSISPKEELEFMNSQIQPENNSDLGTV